jgi:hypothetical protein
MILRTLSAFVVATVLCTLPAFAQDRETVRTPLRAIARELKVFVLQGEGAVNSIRTRSATEPVVEVRDERNQPVQGAEVVFQLPAVGPGGLFAGQKSTWTGRTDANGQVVAAGFVPNQEQGRFHIRVTATHSGNIGRATVAQSNSIRPVPSGEPRRAGHSGWWKAVAVMGAGGAVGGILWATRRGEGRPTVVLQPGTVSFSGPR